MALQSTVANLKDMLHKITQDIQKAEGGNKAAAQRVRTMTVRLEKVAKHYRKESIASEKNTKGVKKTVKKAAVKTKAKAPAKKVTHHAPAHKAAHAPKAKAKPKAKATAMARPRALSFKRPTAKLPTKKAR